MNSIKIFFDAIKNEYGLSQIRSIVNARNIFDMYNVIDIHRSIFFFPIKTSPLPSVHRKLHKGCFESLLNILFSNAENRLLKHELRAKYKTIYANLCWEKCFPFPWDAYLAPKRKRREK